jgi:hypothetical protein
MYVTKFFVMIYPKLFILIKSFRAISRVKSFNIADVSGTGKVPETSKFLTIRQGLEPETFFY